MSVYVLVFYGSILYPKASDEAYNTVGNRFGD